MKHINIRVFFISLVLSISFYGIAADVTTDLWLSKPPSPNKVRTAIQALENALEVREQSLKTDRYEVKIYEARNLLENEDGIQTFGAQIFCDGKDALTGEEDVPNCPADMCYKGDIEEARELLKAALGKDLISYSVDNFFENPRIRKGKLLLDHVEDALRESFEITKCK